MPDTLWVLYLKDYTYVYSVLLGITIAMIKCILIIMLFSCDVLWYRDSFGAMHQYSCTYPVLSQVADSIWLELDN